VAGIRQAYFVNIPSKFISPDGRTVWLCFSGNWTHRIAVDPAGSRHAMCLYDLKLVKPGERPAADAQPREHGTR